MNEWKSVYVMKTDNGTIKIGISKDVSKRAKALNCLYPFNIIDFYKTKPCSNAFEIEKIMHTKFSKEKYFGEWFYADYDYTVSCLKNVFSKKAEFVEKPEIYVDWGSVLGIADIKQREEYEREKDRLIDKLFESIEFQNEQINELLTAIKRYENMVQHLQKCIYTDYLKPDEEESFLQGKNKVEMEGLLEREQIEEIKDHIYRRGVNILGGKQSEAYHDASIRSSVYSDMYRQLKREYGAVSSYKSIKRKYIADVHEFIDCYEPPTVLAEQINGANAQMRFGG